MKILFIAELSSRHAARWIRAVDELGIESVAFQATFERSLLCPEMAGFRGEAIVPVKFEGPFEVKQRAHITSQKYFELLSKLEGIYSRTWVRRLVDVIEQFNPDIVHCLGLCVNFNNLGRMISEAYRSMDNFPPVIYSSWGADLAYYPEIFPDQIPVIRSFLEKVDGHISECNRDVRLAKKFGFKGKTLGFVPANGGIDSAGALPERKRPIKERRKILIKGRDVSDGDPVGRAMIILEALELVPEAKDYEICILQASGGLNVINRARELEKGFGLNVKILPYLPEEDLFHLLSESLLFIAMTVNDGLPLSLVEAMTYGAYPIHSDLESVRDYIKPRENGSLVPLDSAQSLAAEIRWALSNSDHVQKSQAANFTLSSQLFERSVVKEKVAKMYSECVPSFATAPRRRLSTWRSIAKNLGW